MAKITIIGDVHGKTQQYQKMLRQKFEGQRTIQCGDMGIGFSGVGLHEMTPNHMWFRGNHDDPEKCRKNKNYLGDWGYLPDDRLFYIAGAFSIDRAYRIPGISWWEDEELSWAELDGAIDLYKAMKPRFVISHDCPEEANKWLLADLHGPYFEAKGGCAKSRTCSAMQVMLDFHQPEQWVFGHYHIDKAFKIPRFETQFRCVAELSAYELDTDPK